MGLPPMTWEAMALDVQCALDGESAKAQMLKRMEGRKIPVFPTVSIE